MPLAPPIIEDLLAFPLSKFTTFATNDCRYSVLFTEIFVTVVHQFAEKSSLKHDPHWNQVINEPFADEYWKAAKKEIRSFERMNSWEVFDF